MSVYLLEDDPGVSDSLTFFLEELGHDVEVFADAETFLCHEAPKADDTVIVDLGLPGLDGGHVIREIGNLADPPRVIAISGQTRNAIERQLHGNVVPVVLRKPLSEDILLQWLCSADTARVNRS